VLAFRAINGLLPKIVGRSTHVTDKYLERYRPAAVAKWLEGEVAYRNARYRDALNYYRAALASDSSLVAAALKGAMTAAWLSEYPAGDTLIQLALTGEKDLPPVNRVFARGLQQQFAGNGDSAMIFFRKAVQSAPEWSEGWYGVGEAAYHLWPSGDNLDSIARIAYQQSFELDPDFAPVVFHLAELTIVDGRVDLASRLVNRHGDLSADEAQQIQLELMLKCVGSGPEAVDWSALAQRDEPGSNLLAAGRLLASGGRHLACAEGAYRAAILSPAPDEDLSRRWDAALGLHHIYVARGENARAQRLTDSVAATGLRAGRFLRVLDAVLGIGPVSAAAAEMATMDTPLVSMTVERLWWFGEWSAFNGNITRLDSIAQRLRIVADTSGRAADAVPARVMRARLLLMRGDTAAAVDSLRVIRPTAPFPRLVWRYWEALAPERMLLAGLLSARARPREALRIAESFDGQRTVVDVAHLRPSLELRLRAAGELNNSHLREEYAQRLAALNR
jgi:tetratricopeptide (TPR) repeat protein